MLPRPARQVLPRRPGGGAKSHAAPVRNGRQQTGLGIVGSPQARTQPTGLGTLICAPHTSVQIRRSATSHIFWGARIPVRGLSLFLDLTRQSRKGLCKAQTRDLVLGCLPFALSWSRGGGALTAALLPAAALWPLDATWRCNMTTRRPPWMGRPPLPELRPARCLQGGRRHRASSARRLGGQHRSNAGESGKARVFDCAIGAQSVLSSTHAHPTCASPPRTSTRPAPSPAPEMPMVTTALR